MVSSGWLCVCALVVVLVGPEHVLGQVTDATLWKPAFDRVSARAARVRFYGAMDVPNPATTTSITGVLIQWSNVSSQLSSTQTLKTFHEAFGTGSNLPGDSEVTLLHTANPPPVSYTFTNLQPSTTYQVRVGAYQTVTGQTSLNYYPSDTYSATFPLQTPALSNVVSSSLLVSGGCGHLLSDGTRYYLTQSTEGTNIVYTCRVVAESSNVTITIVPNHAYATISTSTQPLVATNLSLTATSAYVIPLTQYNTTLFLGGANSITNFTWTVTAESGVNQTYVLSVTQAGFSATAKIAGPSSPVVAMVKSPATATNLQYRGLTWSATTISQWKVWSDDVTTFPFNSLVLTNAGTNSPTLQVTPSVASVPDGACSYVYVALFDNAGNSVTSTTCISALNDYCSSTPFGAATKWQNPWGNVAATTLPPNVNASALYFPAPPYPTFPIA